MKKTIALFAAMLLMCAFFAGCANVQEDTPVDIAPQETEPADPPAADELASSIVSYVICTECLTEFPTTEELSAHECAQDAYREEALHAMAQSISVIANLYEVEGLSYPVEDVVSDYAISYLFIYANLYLGDRAAEAEVESEYFDRFIALEEAELAKILDAAFGSRFGVNDLVLEDYSPMWEQDGVWYLGEGEVIEASASYQGFGTLAEEQATEYLYQYSVNMLGEITEGTFSVELIPSETYEGALSLAGVFLG